MPTLVVQGTLNDPNPATIIKDLAEKWPVLELEEA